MSCEPTLEEPLAKNSTKTGIKGPSMLEHVLTTCRPVTSKICKILSTSDLCSLGSVFCENNELRLSIRQELIQRKRICFKLYFEPRGFGVDVDSGDFYADILKIHLPKSASKIFKRVNFNRQIIIQQLGWKEEIHNYPESDICKELEDRFSNSLFIIRVALDLINFSCSCVSVLHVFPTTCSMEKLPHLAVMGKESGEFGFPFLVFRISFTIIKFKIFYSSSYTGTLIFMFLYVTRTSGLTKRTFVIPNEH